MAVSETIRRIQRARTTLLIDQPFFGVLALQLKVLESTINQTAWTDGQSMGFNPVFVATLSQDELIGVICHEVMHCACGHPWRESGRQHNRWNQAADYAINPVITSSGMRLPKGALLDSAFDGKNAEWIYDRLPENEDEESSGCGCGEVLPSPAGDSDSDTDPNAKGNGQPQPINTAGDWAQYTKQAAAAAKAQGKLPAGMEREIEAATKPIVDWRSLLRKYMQDVCTADYSWTQPNRRYLHNGLFLPSLRSTACGKIAVAVDTSGSIDTITLAKFSGEMQAIFSEMQPSSVDVLYCDAAVHRVDTFERGESFDMHPVGGGGTAFEPIFNHYDQPDAEQPVVIVVFTDMYGSFPSDSNIPTIWASTSEVDSAPFGDIVPINQ
jgi:predicted metal-dependent peptidase